jgi:hypothetical protein
MKTYLSLIALCAALICGCVTNTPGRILATTTTTVDAAMQGWATYDALGQAEPEQIEKVREAYLRYQEVERIAELAYVASVKTGDKTAWEQSVEALKATQANLLALIAKFQPKAK